VVDGFYAAAAYEYLFTFLQVSKTLQSVDIRIAGFATIYQYSDIRAN